MPPPLTNYLTYTLPSTPPRPRIGHLDPTTSLITPLSYASGTPLTSLYQVIEAGTPNITPSPGPRIPLSSVRILAPLPDRDVLAIGKNYAEHAREFNASGYDASDRVDMPSHPVVFSKRATSIVAQGEPILAFPGFTQTLDYEGEIGVVVGRAGHAVREEDAAGYVWGYTIVNDVTARERQRDHKQFFVGKSGDGFCPMGPVAVPKEDLPGVLRVETRVNGEVRQVGSTEDLIFPVARLIATISMAQTIRPGDVIATGTPAGVGFGLKPPQFLKEGDVVEVEVTGLGTLRNAVVGGTTTAAGANYVYERVSRESAVPTSNLERTGGGVGLTSLPSGKQAFVRQLGDLSKPAIIFVHGLGGSHANFIPLIRERKLDGDYRCVLYDLEGHGLSPTRADSVVSISSLAQDLRHVSSLVSSGTPVTVIAEGLGSRVALQWVGEPGALVKDLILINPPEESSSTVAKLRNHELLVREGGLYRIIEDVLPKETSGGITPAVYGAIVQSLLSQDVEGYAKGCRALAEAGNVVFDPQNISGRALVIQGSVPDRELPQWTSSPSPKVTHEVLDGVGSWALYELQKLGGAVGRFLKP